MSEPSLGRRGFGRRIHRRLTLWVKPLERGGRWFLQQLIAWLFRVTPRDLALPPRPRILVVRLDRRIGNLLLLSPFLRSLQATYPAARITLLCHRDMAPVLAHLPMVAEQEHYVKWQLFSAAGVFAMLARLRGQHFDLVFDAGSFFGSAVTHPLITCLSGARFRVGPSRPPLERIYHRAVPTLPEPTPDIDQRLQLLTALPQPVRVREMMYATAPTLLSLAAEHRAFVASAAPSGLAQTVVIVVGGRVAERQLPPEAWAQTARMLAQRGFAVSLLWGPNERSQAELIAALAQVAIAPASSLDQAAVLFRNAAAVIGHDTGTSHLAVAVGGRLFAAFVATDPRRYGHTSNGSGYVDLREEREPTTALLAALAAWLT